MQCFVITVKKKKKKIEKNIYILFQITLLVILELTHIAIDHSQLLLVDLETKDNPQCNIR